MPAKLTLELTADAKQELEKLRDNHPKPYVRERAGALLKIAAGQSGRSVAISGLLRPRDPDSIYAWLHRYKEEGIQGLFIRNGRGRKPAFFP